VRHIFDLWYSQKYYGAETLWLDYLVWRCRNETDESVGRYAEIRAVAASLVGHWKTREGARDLDYDSILRELCRLALYRGIKYPGTWVGWASSCDPNSKLSNPEGNLLSAACYSGCSSLVKELLAKGGDPSKDCTLFASPAHLAAWAGQPETLQLVMEHLPELVINDPGSKWRGHRIRHISGDALVGAASRGDMDLVQLVLFPPSRIIPKLVDAGKVPDSMLIMGHEPGSIPRDSNLWGSIRSAMARTPSPEIYSYLGGLLSPGDAKSEAEGENYWLARRAASGDVVMVRHLLDIGADAADRSGRQGPALTHAVRGCHVDVVDLLLERGADPNNPGGYRLGTPLTAAAKAGSMLMLRKLLDAGAETSKKDSYTLRHAIMKEHTAMAELLLSRGVGTDRGRTMFLDQARKAGMDSMVDLLRSRGVAEPKGQEIKASTCTSGAEKNNENTEE